MPETLDLDFSAFSLDDLPDISGLLDLGAEQDQATRQASAKSMFGALANLPSIEDLRQSIGMPLESMPDELYTPEVKSEIRKIGTRDPELAAIDELERKATVRPYESDARAPQWLKDSQSFVRPETLSPDDQLQYWLLKEKTAKPAAPTPGSGDWIEQGIMKGLEYLPGTQHASTIANAIHDIPVIYRVSKAINDNDTKDLQPGDMQVFAKMLDGMRRQQEAEGKKSFGRKVGEGFVDLALHLPADAVEYVFTAGMIPGAGKMTAAALEKMAQKAMQKALGKLSQTAVGGAAQAVAGKLAGGAATSLMQAILNPGAVAAETARQLTPEMDIQAGEDTTIGLDREQPDSLRDFAIAGFKGTMGATVENLTEKIGGMGNDAVKEMAKNSPSFQRFIDSKWSALFGLNKPDGKYSKLVHDIGYDGILGEMVEERAADIIRGATGLEKNYGVAGAIVGGTPQEKEKAYQQLLSEALAFSLAGGVGAASEFADASQREAYAKAATKLAAQGIGPIGPNVQPGGAAQDGPLGQRAASDIDRMAAELGTPPENANAPQPQVTPAAPSPELAPEAQPPAAATQVAPEVPGAGHGPLPGVVEGQAPAGEAGPAAGQVDRFVPTDEWQEVPENAIMPPGLDIRMDVTTGKTMARKMPGAEASNAQPAEPGGLGGTAPEEPVAGEVPATDTAGAERTSRPDVQQSERVPGMEGGVPAEPVSTGDPDVDEAIRRMGPGVTATRVGNRIRATLPSGAFVEYGGIPDSEATMGAAEARLPPEKREVFWRNYAEEYNGGTPLTEDEKNIVRTHQQYAESDPVYVQTKEGKQYVGQIVRWAAGVGERERIEEQLHNINDMADNGLTERIWDTPVGRALVEKYSDPNAHWSQIDRDVVHGVNEHPEELSGLLGTLRRLWRSVLKAIGVRWPDRDLSPSELQILEGLMTRAYQSARPPKAGASQLKSKAKKNDEEASKGRQGTPQVTTEVAATDGGQGAANEVPAQEEVATASGSVEAPSTTIKETQNEGQAEEQAQRRKGLLSKLKQKTEARPVGFVSNNAPGVLADRKKALEDDLRVQKQIREFTKRAGEAEKAQKEFEKSLELFAKDPGKPIDPLEFLTKLPYATEQEADAAVAAMPDMENWRVENQEGVWYAIGRVADAGELSREERIEGHRKGYEKYLEDQKGKPKKISASKKKLGLNDKFSHQAYGSIPVETFIRLMKTAGRTIDEVLRDSPTAVSSIGGPDSLRSLWDKVQQDVEPAPEDDTLRAQQAKEFGKRKVMLQELPIYSQVRAATKSREEADAVMSLLQARAEAAGEPVDSYISKRIAAIVTGGEATGTESLYQRDPGRWWYKKSRRVIAEMKQNKGTGEQFLSVLKKAGVKEEELQWTGLADFLYPRKSYTKDEVLSLIDASFNVEEVVRRTAPMHPLDMSEADRKTYEKSTSYDSYTTPGGSDYTELLITIPNPTPPVQLAATRSVPRGDLSRDELGALRDRLSDSRAAVSRFGSKFHSTHWEEDNIVVHVRFSTFTGSDGKKVLFVDEVQSDWHQQGRKSGYSTDPWAARNAPPDAPFRKSETWGLLGIKRVIQHAAENGFDRVEWLGGKAQAKRYSLASAVDRIEWGEVTLTESQKSGQYLALLEEDGRVIGDGQTPEEATARAEKWIDRYGVRGSDSFTVVHHGGVEASPGEKIVKILIKDGDDIIGLVSKDDGKFRVSSATSPDTAGAEDIDGKDLSEIVGQDVANRIMEEDSGSLDSGDLTVGGEGMIGFYDKILPSAVNGFIKRFGSKVERSVVRTDSETEVVYSGPIPTLEDVKDMWQTKKSENAPGWILVQLGHIATDMDSGSSFDAAISRLADGTDVARLFGGEIEYQSKSIGTHAFDITPQMRQSAIDNGMPLWQKDGERAKGAVEFTEDGRAIVKAFESADVSTLVHELGHIFRRDLTGEDLEIAKEFSGVVGDEWTREAEEKFARGWEKYLYDGVAPTNKLKRLFQKFSKWLRKIYDSILGTEVDIAIPEKMRGVYDRLLATGESIERAKQRMAMYPKGSKKQKIDTAWADMSEPGRNAFEGKEEFSSQIESELPESPPPSAPRLAVGIPRGSVSKLWAGAKRAFKRTLRVTKAHKLPDNPAAGFDDPELEEARRGARGVWNATWVQRLLDIARFAPLIAHRSNLHIPTGLMSGEKAKKWASANEGFRALKSHYTYVKAMVANWFNKMLDPLVKASIPTDRKVYLYDLIEQKYLADNLVFTTDPNGNNQRWFKTKSGKEVDHPTSLAYQAKIDKAIADLSQEEQDIVAAVRSNRNDLRRALVQKLIDYKVPGFNEGSLDNEAYYHQMVLEYARDREGIAFWHKEHGDGGSTFVGSGVKRKVDLSGYEFNTNFLEAEAAFVETATSRIGMESIMAKYIGVYDRAKEFRKEAAQENWYNAVGGPAEARKIDRAREIRNRLATAKADRNIPQSVIDDIDTFTGAKLADVALQRVNRANAAAGTPPATSATPIEQDALIAISDFLNAAGNSHPDIAKLRRRARDLLDDVRAATSPPRLDAATRSEVESITGVNLDDLALVRINAQRAKKGGKPATHATGSKADALTALRGWLKSVDPTYEIRKQVGQARGVIKKAGYPIDDWYKQGTVFRELTNLIKDQTVPVDVQTAAQVIMTAKPRMIKAINKAVKKNGKAITTAESIAKRVGGYSEFRPGPKNVFFRTFGITDQVMSRAMDRIVGAAIQMANTGTMNVKEQTQVRQTQAMWLPDELVAQLETAELQIPTWAKTMINTFVKPLDGLAKWALLKLPWHVIKYEASNWKTDLGIVRIVGSGYWGVDLFREILNAKQQLLESPADRMLSTDPEVRAAVYKNVVGSGFNAFEFRVFQDVNQLDAVQQLLDSTKTDWQKAAGKISSAGKWYSNMVASSEENNRKIREWTEKQKKALPQHAAKIDAVARLFKAVAFGDQREDMFRFGAFKYFKAKLIAGGGRMLDNRYGVSDRNIVQALYDNHGVDDAAAYMARSTFGDYTNVSLLAQLLARNGIIPFYRWFDTVMSRSWWMLREVLHQEGMTAKSRLLARYMFGAMLTTLKNYGVLGAAYRLLTGGDEKNAFGLVDLSNIERDLPESDRFRAHLTLGRDARGNPLIMRNAGLVEDALGTFGAVEAVIRSIELYQGKRGASLAGVLSAPANALQERTLGSLSPYLKSLGMVAIDRQSPFFDLMQQVADQMGGSVGLTKGTDQGLTMASGGARERLQLRPAGEVIARNYGMGDQYEQLRHYFWAPGEKHQPGKDHFLKYVFGVVDKKETALGEAHQIVSEFMKDKDVDEQSVNPTSQFQALRSAVKNNDYESFVQARARWIRNNPQKEYASFRAFQSKMNPMDRVPVKYQVEFANSLTPDERVKMETATEFAEDAKATMWRWWNDAAESDSPEIKEKFTKAMDTELLTKLRIIGQGIDMTVDESVRAKARVAGVSAMQYLRARNEEKQAEKEAAEKWLRDRMVSTGRLEEVVRNSLERGQISRNEADRIRKRIPRN